MKNFHPTFRSVRGLVRSLGLALGLAGAAFAQPALQSTQSPVPTLNLSSTIGSTGVFQSIQAANPARRGCLIQNTSSNSQYLFFGPIASATTAKSILLAAGAGMPCNTAGIVTTDQISITGTATDTFYAGIQ